VQARGGFVVNCDHGAGHCESPPEVIAAQWEFLKAHPFGVTPEPYRGGLPATFPSSCQIVQSLLAACAASTAWRNCCRSWV
jgi:hypothetical protein